MSLFVKNLSAHSPYLNLNGFFMCASSWNQPLNMAERFVNTCSCSKKEEDQTKDEADGDENERERESERKREKERAEEEEEEESNPY